MSVKPEGSGKKSPQELISWAQSERVEFIDVRFTDMLGTMHHFTMPLHAIDEEAFDYGIGIDGSSIRGWKAINESDMLAKLDASTAFVDPFFQHKTLAIFADIYDPISEKPYSRDPRYILKKAVQYMKKTGIADTAYFGPEAEFFIFSDVRFDQQINNGFYFLDSIEAQWRMGAEENPNLGYKVRQKGGYFPLPPTDVFQDLRGEMLHVMERMGIATEKHHHEVATGGQAEINLVVDEVMKMADKIQLYKYVVKNCAKQAGYSATFLPKPLFGDNGSGMHTHQSLWKNGKNLFAGNQYGNLSEMALQYTAGILQNGPSLLAFTNPTTNSYKRLVPGFEAPVNLVYSARNRSASIRVPIAVTGDKARRIEFRTPDPSANPYLAFAAMLMAGLDGVKNKMNPGKPADFNLYEASAEVQAKIPAVPHNLTKVIDALEENNKWLTEGNVFDQDFIKNYIDYKRNEIEQIVNQRPHPYEFVLYYDI
ncbi:MAG: type I glutamate--ammonia ligase [Spirochaetia bacterium]|nr:type I glutamate--ammonia ligase [Spirochaetia bacterium]